MKIIKGKNRKSLWIIFDHKNYSTGYEITTTKWFPYISVNKFNLIKQ